MPSFPHLLQLPRLVGSDFPAFSWHASQSQAWSLTGEAQPHGGQDSASLPTPQGTQLQPHPVVLAGTFLGLVENLSPAPVPVPGVRAAHTPSLS